MRDDYLFEDLGLGPPEPQQQQQQSKDDFRDLSELVGNSVGEVAEPTSMFSSLPVVTSVGEISLPSLPRSGSQPPSMALGLSLLGAIGAGVAGGLYAGGWGAAAGVAASGAMANMLRYTAAKATGSDQAQASAHLVFAIVSAAAAVYTGRKAYASRKERTTRTLPMRPNKEKMPKWLTPAD